MRLPGGPPQGASPSDWRASAHPKSPGPPRLRGKQHHTPVYEGAHAL